MKSKTTFRIYKRRINPQDLSTHQKTTSLPVDEMVFGLPSTFSIDRITIIERHKAKPPYGYK